MWTGCVSPRNSVEGGERGGFTGQDEVRVIASLPVPSAHIETSLFWRGLAEEGSHC
jgi:hypothetical protein